MSLVSIVVPIYNCEEDLEECLQTLQGQTYKNIEVIMIDDGSIDSSAEICRKFSEVDFRFKLFLQNNQGVSRTRNRGIKVAKGEYIMFVDGDDKACPDMVETYVNAIKESDSDVVIGGITFCDKEEKKWDKKPLKTGCYGLEIWNDIVEDSEGIYGYISNKLYRIKIIKENSIWFNEMMYAQEDLDFALSVYGVCTKFTQIMSSHYIYKYRPGKRKHPVTDYIGNQLKMSQLAEKADALSEENRVLLKNRIAGMLYNILYWSDEDACNKIYNYAELANYLQNSKNVTGEKKLIVALYCKNRRDIITLYFNVRHKIKKVLR